MYWLPEICFVPHFVRVTLDDGRSFEVPLVFNFPAEDLYMVPSNRPLPRRVVIDAGSSWRPRGLPAVTLDAWRILNGMNAKLREQTLAPARPKLLMPPDADVCVRPWRRYERRSDRYQA